MSLTPPKRLFHIPSMSTVMYEDVADDVKEKGYVCVSHVWGNQKMFTASELSITDGVNWEVPLSNLEKMVRVRIVMAYFKEKYCWWDILCIPQDKQDEINLEIPFMGDYYSGADVTLVLSDICHTISEDYFIWDKMMDDVLESRREITPLECEWIMSYGRELIDFYRDKWFTRVWTLQEAVLSREMLIIGTDGRWLNLSCILRKLAYVSQANASYEKRLFEKSHKIILGVAIVIEEYSIGTLSLEKILRVNSKRDCHKIHDRIYGILGILKYKDIIVNYNQSIDRLNREIIRYSYSKGDISWIAVGEDIRTGFIQPMYRDFLSVGSGWREDASGTCNISFRGNAFYANMATFGTVLYCKRFADSGLNKKASVIWTIRLFRELGHSASTILDTLLSYKHTSDVLRQKALGYLERFMAYMDSNLTTHLDPMDRFFMETIILLADIAQGNVEKTVVVEVSTITDEYYPLIVLGRVEIGDKILTLKIHDYKRRRLGIVVSNSLERKGVCFIPPIDISDNLYTLHRFQL